MNPALENSVQPTRIRGSLCHMLEEVDLNQEGELSLRAMRSDIPYVPRVRTKYVSIVILVLLMMDQMNSGSGTCRTRNKMTQIGSGFQAEYPTVISIVASV